MDINNGLKLMEEIFKLIDEEKIQSAIEKIQENLSKEEKPGDFTENFINSLNRLELKSEIILRALLPNLLKLITIENDVLRYSLLLSIKPLSENNPEIIVPFAKEYLMSENSNSREGMLQLLTFAATTKPDIVKPLIDTVTDMLADEKDFVQKKAISLLKVLGKKYALEIEKKLVEFVQSTTNVQVRENSETVLKSIVNIKKLETEELEKRQIEVEKKVLDEKEKIVTEEENKVKQEELQKREEMLTIKKESKEIDDALKEKEKELLEKEIALKEKELRLKEAKILIEEKEKEIEEEKIRQKAENLAKDMEIHRKRTELDRVKKELEMKELEKEKEQIIKDEQTRMDKRLSQMEEEEEEEEKVEKKEIEDEKDTENKSKGDKGSKENESDKKWSESNNSD